MVKDRNAVAHAEIQITEYERSLAYFTQELAKLQARKASAEESLEPALAALEIGSTRANSVKKQYTNLELSTSDTPYNKPKVSLKLHEIDYKADLERKLLSGIKNLVEAIGPSKGGRRRQSEVNAQMEQSLQKLDLLNRALRKYKGLYLDDTQDDGFESTLSTELPSGIRQPVTGTLHLQIMQARNLEHVPTRSMRAPVTVATAKMDGNIVYRSHPTRTDKWFENCEIHVNKGSELEIEIYDESSDKRRLIGIIWLKIADIAEALLRDGQDDIGWVSARIAQEQGNILSADSNVSAQTGYSTPSPPPPPPNNEAGIMEWFDVEPYGELALRLNFVRETLSKKPKITRNKLTRVGAVRQRPDGERHEVNGHYFVEQRFYNVMKCALCGDFLVKSGFRCDDCAYTCHRKCYGRVVTKCITRSQTDSDKEEDRLNHRIPHRFVQITNIGANWCCHCGHVLSLGSRKARKCSECGITSHTTCARLVPDFCGLSMEIANQMLAEIRAAQDRPTPPPHRQSMPVLAATTSGSTQTPALISRTNTIGDVESIDSLSVQASDAASVRRYSLTSVGDSNSNEDPYSNVYTSGNTDAMIPRLRIPPRGNRVTCEEQEQDDNSTVVASREDPYLRIYQQLDIQLQGHYSETPVSHHNLNTPIDDLNDQRRQEVSLQDFSFQTVIGRGTFGKVILARNNHDRKPYAIKILKKRSMLDDDSIESTRLEKRVFQAVNRNSHPFLTKLHSSFQTDSHLFFVMEYISGGDLMSHIQRETFSERRAKFYASEVLLGLEHFHNLGIIYRDLKLENIMLGPDGHIKIGDYGMCKDDMWYGSKTNTMCGTPGFMAPEILLHQGYGRAVDWWAFGVLIYQMVFARPPFPAEHDDEIYDATLNDEILYPMKASTVSISICEQLLNRDPTRRLGSGEGDAAEVKAHPFFNGIDWKALLAKRVCPPFLPTIVGALDTSNFDEEFTQETPDITPTNSILSPAEQQEFKGFDYTAEWAANSTDVISSIRV
ncbi:kinase-like domain-containing protein [Zychaea mexicana]|uniref:kinase-like domain-containing protein n=1 Tax=Zychaea mexicana TaxID=64656 RepID=UPI0022FE9083|nr:kinase-like domain-containing protein [Zychaea mexicana]KAI9482516.1 kinase-like domain-containing protein [Zychaea mexicana]